MAGDDGRVIKREVKALPPAAIPEPLAIGILRLFDGAAPKVFAVETTVAGAVDTTRCGGWLRNIASRAATSLIWRCRNP